MEPWTALERRAALEQLLPHLRRYARSLTGRADEADDLVEECLRLGLWRTVQPELPAQRSRVFKSLRSRFIEAGSGRPWGTRMALQEEGAAGIWPMARERGRLAGLRLAFTLLPTDQREVLNLVVMDGMSYEEAGAILDVPAATVQLRIAQARSELAQEVGPGGMITIPKGGGQGVEMSAGGEDDLGADRDGGTSPNRDHRCLN
ncbi:MAG TPA: RNA polymerase sigma factor [Geminicoccaceae bacterium]